MRVVCDAVLVLYLVAACDALISWVADDAACLAAVSRRLMSFLFIALVAAVLVAERSSSAALFKASW